MEKANQQLPVIAVRGDIPLPNNQFRIEVGREQSVNALLEAEKNFDDNIILLIQKSPLDNEITQDNLHSIGVVAKVIMKMKNSNGNYKVKFRILNRIEVVNLNFNLPFIMSEFRIIADELVANEETQALLRTVSDEVRENARYILQHPDVVVRTVSDGLSADVASDIIAYNLKGNIDRYRYLAQVNVEERLKYILEDISREKKISEIENKINNDLKKQIDDTQKEYYLREKMKVIQNELGDKARQDSEVEDLRKQIEAANMPKNIHDKALNELKRFQSTPPQIAESGIIKNYLDFLVNLPWTNISKDNDNLKEVKESLDTRHYALDKVKERIIEYLAVKVMTGKNPQTILCLVGPPGVGKTSLAKSISIALGRKFVKASLGGVTDESEIRGHRRTYIGALPGRILKGMRDAGVCNPVFLLDEIDKMSSDYKGDPSAAMLEVLDPEQNSHFSDNYVEESYDLSQVMFITTANNLGDIPAPLRDRMEIVQLSSYTEIEKFNIAYKHLIPKQLDIHGLSPTQLVIKDEAMYKIIRSYTREAGVRELDRMIGALCRKAVTQILIEKKKNLVVEESNVEQFLGKVRFFNNESREKGQIGVVTGLAYTVFGGDTLDIEVTYYKGKGGFVLTGKLGDVMKESAQTALSYVKSNAKKFGIDEKLFTENDIHIHVPEGAVPKDGPSAGVTLATAIVSALTKKPVDSHIGMTGEITLRGSVLPIGGLKEKSIAAHRSGLKKIFIPKENERDIEDIPEEVKKELEIVPVSEVSQIITQVVL